MRWEETSANISVPGDQLQGTWIADNLSDGLPMGEGARLASVITWMECSREFDETFRRAKDVMVVKGIRVPTPEFRQKGECLACLPGKSNGPFL